eukprot:5591065-Amphidinium_carterae.1
MGRKLFRAEGTSVLFLFHTDMCMFREAANLRDLPKSPDDGSQLRKNGYGMHSKLNDTNASRREL